MIELVPRGVFNALVNDKHPSFVGAFSARKGVIIIKLYKAEVICLARGDSAATALLGFIPKDVDLFIYLYLTGSRPTSKVLNKKVKN